MPKPIAAPLGDQGRQRQNAKRAANFELARQAGELSKELGVNVSVNDTTGSFRVLGGYTASSSEGVRRLVKRLQRNDREPSADGSIEDSPP